jgi:branched-chain amino acid transport system substrate-binding protein
LVAGLQGGCGGQGRPRDEIAGRQLTVYAAVPLDGPWRTPALAVIGGERLALRASGARIGPLHVRLRVLDDATAARGAWDPGQASEAAKLAATDPTTVGYLGDLDSGASAVSLPLLERTGIVQISPTSSAVGLTRSGPGADPGEPQKYYPAGARTFVRLVPGDDVEAVRLAGLAHRSRCRRTVVIDDGGFDGAALAATLTAVLPRHGLPVVASDSFDPSSGDPVALATSVAAVAADCAVIAALAPGEAGVVGGELQATLPHLRLFASGIDELVLRGRRGQATLTALGYTAMRLLLAAVGEASDGGRGAVRRSQVREALFSSRLRTGPAGPFSVNASGDTTLAATAVAALHPGAG